MKPKLSIYFIHSKDLVMRKQVCETFISKVNNDFDVKVVYVEDEDPKDIDIVKIRELVKLEKSKTNDIFDALLKNIHVKQLSNTLKHLHAYKEIENSDDEFSLILEDDVIYSNEIVDNLKQCINNIRNYSNEWNILFTGMPQPSGLNISQPIINVNEIYKLIPVCDSYFVNRKNVSQLISKFTPIKFCTNIQLSYLFAHEGIKACMCVPNIFFDGSKYGMFLSSLEANNKLFLNPEYNKLVSIINKKEYTNDDKNNIVEINKKMQFANHPDFLYQLGLYEFYNKNFSKAKEIFDGIYDIYTKNNSIINSESEFLFNYCNLFAHFQ